MKSKLNVLFVTNQLIYGGAERYTVSVANYLQNAGCNVAVISSGGPMRKLLNKKIKHYYAPVKKTDIFSRIRTIITVLYVSLTIKAQLVHTQSAQGALVSKIAKMVTGIPVVKTAHGYPDGVIPTIAKSLNFTTDKVVMISDWLSHRMTSFGLKKEKAKTILNGIDTKQFVLHKVDKDALRRRYGLGEKDEVIVSVARIVPEKKFEEFVSWFPYILAKKPNAKLLLVGNGGSDGDWYRNKLIKQIDSANLGKSIKILKGTNKVSEVLSIADVFCTPSVGKGFSVLEAMAAGLPVVARRPRGVADTVKDGINGFLFSSGDWRSMAEKIVFLLENKKIARELGQQGRMVVRSHFTLEQMIDKLEIVYLQMIRGNQVLENVRVKYEHPMMLRS